MDQYEHRDFISPDGHQEFIQLLYSKLETLINGPRAECAVIAGIIPKSSGALFLYGMQGVIAALSVHYHTEFHMPPYHTKSLPGPAFLSVKAFPSQKDGPLSRNLAELMKRLEFKKVDASLQDGIPYI